MNPKKVLWVGAALLVFGVLASAVGQPSLWAEMDALDGGGPGGPTGTLFSFGGISTITGFVLMLVGIVIIIVAEMRAAYSAELPTNSPASATQPRLSAPLQIAVAIVAGVLSAAAYLLVSGLLAIQAHGLQWGVAIGLNNSVARFIGSQTPWIQLIALGILVAFAVMSFSPRGEQARGPSMNAHSYAFMATVAAIMVTAMVLTERPYRGGVLGMNGLLPEFIPPVPPEVLIPFTWIQTSALEATTFALVAVLLALHIRSLIRRRTARRV